MGSVTSMLLTKIFLLFSLSVFVQPSPLPEMKIILHLHDFAGPGGSNDRLRGNLETSLSFDSNGCNPGYKIKHDGFAPGSCCNYMGYPMYCCHGPWNDREICT